MSDFNGENQKWMIFIYIPIYKFYILFIYNFYILSI